ncbi:hypothetical protein BKA70DRAFT_1459205 [Coprinopsis sp. MPI-PUGE-AT-0042]|nr:hypothetical protein BKA70DRAFT_1459205 [Coprinopsis sp. MPI-PUGE-AT-0042]
MPPFTHILGWTPPTDIDYIDVAIPEHQELYEDGLHHSSDSFPSFQPSSPASSHSAYSEHERSPEPVGKRGDPNWVARPRNEFILFRCDYVRRHTKEGTSKRTRRQPGQESEKTLSKLAAEAWRALTPEERLHWREQANIERSDHAKKYPDYRYRPKKSTASRKRQSRSSLASSMTPKSAPAPAVVANVTVDSAGRSSGSGSPNLFAEEAGPALVQPSLRKTVSAPYLPSTMRMDDGRSEWDALSMEPSFLARSHSLNYVVTSLTARLTSITHCLLQHPIRSPTIRLGFLRQPCRTPCPCRNSVTSSLINWNGEAVPLSAPQPQQYIGTFSNSLIDPALLFSSPQKPMNTIAESTAESSFYNDSGYLPYPQLSQQAAAFATGPISRQSSNNTQSTSGYHPSSSQASVIYDSSGNALVVDEYGMPCNMGSIHPLTISPADYFAHPADDGVFIMDDH